MSCLSTTVKDHITLFCRRQELQRRSMIGEAAGGFGVVYVAPPQTPLSATLPVSSANTIQLLTNNIQTKTMVFFQSDGILQCPTLPFLSFQSWFRSKR